jgi:hypothetical protein
MLAVYESTLKTWKLILFQTIDKNKYSNIVKSTLSRYPCRLSLVSVLLVLLPYKYVRIADCVFILANNTNLTAD